MSGRVRTKKNKMEETPIVAGSAGSAGSTETIGEQEPIKKVSKKKQFPVVAVITPNGIEGNLMSVSRRPLVVHLPIQSRDVPVNDMPIAYNPLPPTEAQPYDSFSENPFHEEMENIDGLLLHASGHVPSQPSCPSSSTGTTTGEVAPLLGIAETSKSEEIDFYRLKGTLLVQFTNSSEVKAIPPTSDAACFWCCQTFPYRPVVLPVRDTGEHLTAMGNFCCPECACAYLFDMRQDAHTRWEQLSLLNRVYGEVCGGDIHPAPHRTLLTMFGGTLSAEQYRRMIRSHTVRVDVHLPPMVSILATMDTKPIDFYDASLTKNVNETVTERLQKAEEVLRLRRTKPLKAWESTLDACINLKVKYEPHVTTGTLSLES